MKQFTRSYWYLSSIAIVLASSKLGASSPKNVPDFVLVSSGEKHSCAITSENRLFCWGDNTGGQLGVGKHLSSLAVPGEVLSERKFKNVSVGKSHSCALSLQNEVLCWGDGQYGQNGSSSFATEFTPKLVDGIKKASQISLGAEHSCAVTEDSAAFCWGRGDSGQLGIGSKDQRNSRPREVSFGSAISKLSLGKSHSCLLSESSTVFCFGSNVHGQIAQKDKPHALEPVLVDALVKTEVTDIFLGGDHSCILDHKGAAWCWGLGSSAQLGTGDLESSSSPRKVSGVSGFASLQLGIDYTCGITIGNKGLCWGDNSSMKLGTEEDSSTILKPTGTQISDSLGGMGLGYSHSCWVTTYKDVLCVGDGSGGKLGNGSENSEAKPKIIEKVFSSTSRSVLEYCLRHPNGKIIAMVKTIHSVSNCADLAVIADDIVKLDLSGRKLKSLEGIEVFSNIRSLNLNDNQVKDLTPVLKLSRLNEIMLDDNNLAKKTAAVLSKLTYIKKFSMAGNQLNDISFVGTRPRSNLRHLDISRNKVSEVSYLNRYRDLKYIDLSHNDIHSARGLEMFKDLQYFDISHNPLYVENELDRLPISGVFRAANTNLERLKMFEDGKSPNVKEIDISNTRVKDIMMLKDHRYIEVFKGKGSLISRGRCPVNARSEAVSIFCNDMLHSQDFGRPVD